MRGMKRAGRRPGNCLTPYSKEPAGKNSAAKRFALCVEYEGTGFVGWQRQEGLRSVQDTLERALSRVADHPLTVFCAGRTDAGVHAGGQVVHFDTNSVRSPRSWLLGVNSNLPPDVTLRWIYAVPGDFHARFSACSRTYRYQLIQQSLRPVFRRRTCAWVHARLDVAGMRLASEALLGEHDFSAFRGAGCQAKSSVRTIKRLEIRARDSLVCIEIEANAFLYRMVRNIVGSLLVVGRGEASVGWVGKLLEVGNRCAAGPTAPARGLNLLGVDYPERFGLPSCSVPPELNSGINCDKMDSVSYGDKPLHLGTDHQS